MDGIGIGLWHITIGSFNNSSKLPYFGKRKLPPRFITLFAPLTTYFVNTTNKWLNLVQILCYLLTWFFCVSMLKKTLDLQPSQIIIYFYVTGIQIASVSTIFRKLQSLKVLLQHIELMWFAYWKLSWITLLNVAI